MELVNGNFLDFNGKTVLITGAATGIGRTVQMGFASRGANVAIGDINEEATRETLDLVKRDVLFVGQPDSMTPLGTKGVGELAITGMAAAIANAVDHATGMRVRSLPISIEKMLAHESSIARDRSPVAAIAGTTRSASPEAV